MQATCRMTLQRYAPLPVVCPDLVPPHPLEQGNGAVRARRPCSGMPPPRLPPIRLHSPPLTLRLSPPPSCCTPLPVSNPVSKKKCASPLTSLLQCPLPCHGFEARHTTTHLSTLYNDGKDQNAEACCCESALTGSARKS